jgi:hypothetical protein
MLISVGVALTPIAVRLLDRQTVTNLGVVSADVELAERAVGVIDSVLNSPPQGVEPEAWKPPFRIAIVPSAEAGQRQMDAGVLDGVARIERGGNDQLLVQFRSPGLPPADRQALLGAAGLGLAILDWTSSLPADSQLGAFRPPEIAFESTVGSVTGGEPVSQAEIASRSFLGTVLIVMMFISIMIYGMWVATGVAAEKSSRVMELMISAASPRQLIIGKVLGIGAAGLTQFAAIAALALAVLAFQDQLATAILGTANTAQPVGGLTPELLLSYGTLFFLGFLLFAFVYAAAGSFVARPDDLQTLSFPLSLLAMAGYLTALPVLLTGGGGGALSRIASFVPPFSPFAMFARLMVGRVEPWEVVLSLALLVGAIVVVMLAAIRIYSAGVLLYGQRPGFRSFIAAARRAR